MEVLVFCITKITALVLQLLTEQQWWRHLQLVMGLTSWMHKHFYVCLQLVCWNQLVICVPIHYVSRTITISYIGASYIHTHQDTEKVWQTTWNTPQTLIQFFTWKTKYDPSIPLLTINLSISFTRHKSVKNISFFKIPHLFLVINILQN